MLKFSYIGIRSELVWEVSRSTYENMYYNLLKEIEILELCMGEGVNRT